MRNKGLTVIEMVVVVVVICVIVAFAFPSVLHYVNKNRLQADMETAKELADVMTEVLSDDKISDNVVEHATPQLVSNMDGSDFRKAVYEKLETEEIKGKTKKNIDGEEIKVPEFYYTLNVERNQIEIYYGGITEEYKIYPKVGVKLVK